MGRLEGDGMKNILSPDDFKRLQEFQPEAVKWHSDCVEKHYIKWYYDGRLPDNIKITVTDKGIFSETKQ